MSQWSPFFECVLCTLFVFSAIGLSVIVSQDPKLISHVGRPPGSVHVWNGGEASSLFRPVVLDDIGKVQIYCAIIFVHTTLILTSHMKCDRMLKISAFYSPLSSIHNPYLPIGLISALLQTFLRHSISIAFYVNLRYLTEDI